MKKIEFSTNLLSDFKLTYDDLILMSRALCNAILHAENESSRSDLTDESRNLILSDMDDYSYLLDKIDSYLEESGFHAIDNPL